MRIQLLWIADKGNRNTLSLSLERANKVSDRRVLPNAEALKAHARHDAISHEILTKAFSYETTEFALISAMF